MATGDGFFREAVKSAEILREEMDVNITIFTDKEREAPKDFFSISVLDNPVFGFEDKINAMQESPYDQTLYLDTDIYVTSDIIELFDMLDVFELAVAHDVARCESLANDSEPERTVEGVPRSFPEHNTGVIIYRSDDKMNKLLNNWKEDYREGDPHDQPAFRRALYNSNIRFATLPPEYNYFAPSPGFAHGRVRVLHHRILDIDTPGGDMKLDVKEFASNINESTEKRVSYRLGNKVKYIVPSQKPTLSYRLKRSIQNDGIAKTLQKGLSKLIS